MGIETLQTPRLTLCPMRAEHAPDLHDFFSDPQAMRFFGDLHTDLAQTERWVAGTLAAPPERCREYVLLQDGVAIGKAGLWAVPELGFFLRRDRWGQGLMREALSALIPHLFDTMPLDHIRADVDPRNAASLGLLHHLGFVETHRASRTIQIGGEWADSVYLRLSRPDQTRSVPVLDRT
ncbi:GNAT family N-acetyltransferase [Ruegeria pomeroyi]|nr:GNAT family N-acetyltransferase [Ruegeria pomeroyi]